MYILTPPPQKKKKTTLFITFNDLYMAAKLLDYSI